MMKLDNIVPLASKSLDITRKAIPIYKEVSPIMINIKNTIGNFLDIRKEAKASIIHDLKLMERPISNFKKNTLDKTIKGLTLFK